MRGLEFGDGCHAVYQIHGDSRQGAEQQGEQNAPRHAGEEQQLLEPLFTEDELAVFKRGRNASKASVAKHASPEEYRASTGFECLLGWLYLNGQLERVHQLFEVLWQQFDPDQK